METEQPRSSKPTKTDDSSCYASFDQLDGSHPWRDALPDSYLDYPVHVAKHGRVAYFNFRLAREMGLLCADHPDELSAALCEKLIETFSLRIVNEYDRLLGHHVSPDTLKPGSFMATRYLQLQHADTSGRTSGDGRSIWNGVCRSEEAVWDVSSRGTGVTALSPGVVEADRPLETGTEEFGYGCGLAELNELFESTILSEIFFVRGLQTERMLLILDMGHGHGIGVRAARNLMRPAHCFPYLRQDKHEGLRRSFDYLIERQHANGEWDFSPQHPQKWELLLQELCDSFATFTAVLDIDHIFIWPDWDGDNVLAHAGIIDYGCVRQFGLRHDEYRYDDFDRLSPTLSEQPEKMKLIVQTFVQAVDFVQCGAKRPLESFENHETVHRFQQVYADRRLRRILYRLGFDDSIARRLMTSDAEVVHAFAVEYDAIECIKAASPLQRVSDGVNRRPLFNIRNLLREYPRFLQDQTDFEAASLPTESFFSLLFARDVTARDQAVALDHQERASRFQDIYKQLVVKAAEHGGVEPLLKEMQRRSGIINAADRATGDAITSIVEKIIPARDAGLSVRDLGKLIGGFVEQQRLDPDLIRADVPVFAEGSVAQRLSREMQSLLDEHSESV